MRVKWFILLVLLLVGLSPFIAANPREVPLSLSVGDSEIINVKGLTRVSTGNPLVVEVVVTGSQEILLNAKQAGAAVVNIWSSQGVLSYRVTVRENFESFEKELARLIDNPKVRVTVNSKYVILNGAVETTLDADQAVAYAKMYRDNVINNLEAKTKYQVLLSIIVTEIKKENQNKYGFRWGSWVQTKDGLTFMESQTALIENSDHSIVRFPDNWQLGSMIDMMAKNGDAKILAVPSILTLNNQEATFLAGGEIPIPISDGEKVEVQWKEYGVKLKVKPSIAKDRTVSLMVSPEVSTLDWANAISLNGYKLPAIATRRTSTSLQVKPGTTIAIGGLLKREDAKTVFKLPILGDLPIVGALFRSKEFQKGDTELLFFVTPTLVNDNQLPDPNSLTQGANQGPYFTPDNDMKTESKVESRKGKLKKQK
ncbi:MAG TPA: pilus assembly protein N-terminal domain-containing protein [Bacillota bacterium]|nr:pilus assembly protein N-terminal domain-containing protein [Bacillota bacterium]